jgi:hypothetical protein
MTAPPGKPATMTGRSQPPGSAPNAAALARGVTRALSNLGYASLTEFTLRTGRRVDVIAMDAGGAIAIVEIKSNLEDFRADRKWREYLAYCDRFFFAVPEAFPRDVLPEDCGLLLADCYGAAVLRESPLLDLHPTRRRAQILRFAQTAAQRLTGFTDPGLETGFNRRVSR